MSDELKNLAARLEAGAISRRAFLGQAAALGIAGVMAETMFSTAARAAAPKQGGKLSMGLGGGSSTDSLDPALNSNQVPFLYLATMGNTLVTMSAKGEALPSLAESWDSSSDASVWTFKLRQGVEFHDGRTMTADDVVKTLKRHSDKSSKSGAFGILQSITDMKTDGDNVVITLSEPNADIPYLMSDYHLIIQPGGGMDKPDAGIFTGPYKLKSFDPGVRVVMEKFKNHWDGSVGHFDTIEMVVINDATARNAALQAGRVQMVNSVDPKVARLLERSPDIAVPAANGRGYYCFNMLCNAAPFDNNDLRMALKLSIDREEMVDKILAGFGSVGNDMPINGAYSLFDDSIPQRQFDPDKAAYHYKKSGHSGPITLATAETAFPGAVDAAALYAESAKKAGMTLHINRLPDDGYWSEVWRKNPFSGCHWAGRPTQDLMFSTVYTSSASWNDTQFDNAAFDKLIVQARAELDTGKRKELYSEAGRLLRDQGGLINPMFSAFIAAYRKDRIRGWVDNPTQVMMNGLAGVKCWAA